MAITDQLACGNSRRRSAYPLSRGHRVRHWSFYRGRLRRFQGCSSLVLLLMAVLALALWKPDLATLGAVFALWGNLAAAAVRFHHVPAIAAVASFLVLGLPLFYYVIIRREPVRTNGVLGLMLVYLVVQVASAEFSADITKHLSVPSRVFSLQGVVLYFLILNTVRTHVLLRRCLWAMVLAGVLLGTLSLVQRVTHAYGQDYAGFAVSHPFDLSPRLATILRPVDEPEDQAFQALYPTWRAMGSIGDANYYAQIMIVLVPIALLRFWASPSWRERIPALLAVGRHPRRCCALLFARRRPSPSAQLVAALIVFRYLRLRHVLPVVIAANVDSGDNGSDVHPSNPNSRRRIWKSARGRPLDSIAQDHCHRRPGTSFWIIRCSAWVSAKRPSTFRDTAGCTAMLSRPRMPAPTTCTSKSSAETGIVGFGVFLLVLLGGREADGRAPRVLGAKPS